MLNFEDLSLRLIANIRLRINRGDYTERALARALRISQPHLHNVLKGARKLHVQFASALMIKFSITILDLITDEEIWGHLDMKDPKWLSTASTRKPAGKSLSREIETRPFWSESKVRD